MPKIALSEALKGWNNWDQLSLLNPPPPGAHPSPHAKLVQGQLSYIFDLHTPFSASAMPCFLFCHPVCALQDVPKMGTPPPLAPWGTATVSISNARPSLMRKGTTLSANALRAEWMTWPPVYAPNARTTLRSHLPALMLDSIWFALSFADVVRNLRSIAWGLGYCNYPSAWWRTSVHRFLHNYVLLHVMSTNQFMLWVSEGRTTSKDQR